MRRTLAALALAMVALAACGSDAEDDFDAYDVSAVPGEDCTYDRDAETVTTVLRVRGSARGEQTVEVAAEVVDEAGETVGEEEAEVDVDGEFDEQVTVVVTGVDAATWDAGAECRFSAGN